MATTKRTQYTEAEQAAYSAAVAFVDRTEYTPAIIYLRRDDASKPGRLNSPACVSLRLAHWATVQGYTAISDNGNDWHNLTDVLAYIKAGRRSDRIWRGLW